MEIKTNSKSPQDSNEKPQEDPDEIQRLKTNDEDNKINKPRVPGEHNTKKKLRMTGIILLLILNIFNTYVVRPLCVVIQIVFLVYISNLKPREDQEELNELFSLGIKALGWMIMFLIPVYILVTIGFEVVSIHRGFFAKCYSLVLVLIELNLEFPLTFLYDSNLYSLFLFEQRGLEQLINPWLIFFPSDYILSIFQITRNYVDPLFFLIVGFIKYEELKTNLDQIYMTVLLQLMLSLCLLRIVGTLCLTVYRIFYGTSTKGKVITIKSNKKIS